MEVAVGAMGWLKGVLSGLFQNATGLRGIGSEVLILQGRAGCVV